MDTQTKELIELYKTYVKMLQDELTGAAAVASIHGWQSSQYKEGVKLRKQALEKVRDL